MDKLPHVLLPQIFNNPRILLMTSKNMRNAELNRRHAVRTALIHQILQSNLKNKVSLFTTIPLAHPMFNAKTVILLPHVNERLPERFQFHFVNKVSNTNKNRNISTAEKVYYLKTNQGKTYAVLANIRGRFVGIRMPRTKRY
jgi:hypothetical protein